MFGLTALETKLAGALILVVVLGIGYGLWAHHERAVGEAQIIAADAKVLAKAKEDAAVESAKLQAAVNTAHQEAQNAQSQVDSYVAAHPVGVVRVCVTPGSGNRMPGTTSAASGAQGSNAGPAVVPSVSQPVAGPDISDGLAVLVQAAARLAVLEQERQRQP